MEARKSKGSSSMRAGSIASSRTVVIVAIGAGRTKYYISSWSFYHAFCLQHIFFSAHKKLPGRSAH